MFANELFGPVCQMGYLVKDLDAAMTSWTEQLGVGPFWGFRNVPLQSHFAGVESAVTIDVGLAYQNGVQIELIQQLNPESAPSPYSDFYQTESAQMFQQVGYYCLDIDKARATAAKIGLNELGYVESAMGSRYYYYDSPHMQPMVVELMEMDQATLDAFQACADEAADWDGSQPTRLISL